MLWTLNPYWGINLFCKANRLGFIGLISSYATERYLLLFPFVQLLPGASFSHSCSLVFLYAGEYMVSISCSEMTAGQIESKDTVFTLKERTRNSDANLNDGHCNVVKKSWTFSPPIKIHVVYWTAFEKDAGVVWCWLEQRNVLRPIRSIAIK